MQSEVTDQLSIVLNSQYRPRRRPRKWCNGSAGLRRKLTGTLRPTRDRPWSVISRVALDRDLMRGCHVKGAFSRTNRYSSLRLDRAIGGMSAHAEPTARLVQPSFPHDTFPSELPETVQGD